MTPYYDHAGCTIYHGDCREVLPTLDPVDLVLTDPPYGFFFASNRPSTRTGQTIAGDGDTSVRDDVVESLGDVPWAIFGNWKVKPPKGVRTALAWDKGPASGMGDLSLPWKCSWEIIWIGGRGWAGHRGEGVLKGHSIVTWETRGRFHINQKPVSLMVAIAEKGPPGTVLDPFMGSGTTLRAAKDLGRKAIGIEIEEKYCEIAAKRLEQEVFEFEPDATAKIDVQAEMSTA